MEVSPTGQAPQIPSTSNDPLVLLNVMVNLQSQTVELLRQNLEIQRQTLELSREASQVARDQRARQMAELERWQNCHGEVLDHCREALGQLEQVHASLMGEMANYVGDNHDSLMDGEFVLSEFVDRFGPRLAHLNTMLAVLRPLAAAPKKPES
jgi:hypothetical protein